MDVNAFVQFPYGIFSTLYGLPAQIAHYCFIPSNAKWLLRILREILKMNL